MYKIEIWTYGSVDETFEHEDVKEVLEWYGDNWKYSYENGYCTFYVYKDDVELKFETEYELGFYK